MHASTPTVLIANPGADLYGSDRMVLETVRALVDRGHRVVVTVPNSGPLEPLLRDAGAEVVECPTPVVRKGLLSVRGLLTLAVDTVRSIWPGLRLLRRTRPATVIVNTLTPPLWLVLARLTGRRTVCHVHEGEASVSRMLQRALYLPLVFAHRILINSEFSRATMLRISPRLARRTRILYNTVPGPPEVTPPRTTPTSPLRLLYVGRLSQRKGPHVAVEALAQLRRDGHDVVLRLVGAVFPGNEAYAEFVRDTAVRLEIADAVEFAGFQPSVWGELAACDVMLIPSTVDEPFGNTAVEAALAARPSIVSAVGGLPEAAGHSESALLVPPGDAHAIADAVTAIVDDWSTFAGRARKDAVTVAEAFSAERYAAGVLAAVGGSPDSIRRR